MKFATINRLSAAVVVDGNYDFSVDEEGKNTGKLEYIALSDAQINSINNIVRQTVGFNANRGDEVTVSNFEFKPLQKDWNKSSYTKSNR